MTKPLLTALASSLLAACSSTPSAALRPVTRPEPEGVFEFAAGKYSVRDLIDTTAKHLGVNILVDNSELHAAAPLELQTRVRLESGEVEDFVGDLLWSRGFTMIPRNPSKGTYEVISLQGPRAREALSTAVPRTPEEILARPRARTPVTTTVELKHINAVVATNALRPFFAQTGHRVGGGLTLGTAGNPQLLLLSGFQTEVAQVLQALRSVDAPPPDANGLPMASAEERIDEFERQLETMQKRLDALEKRATGGQE